ncbi:MAG TPA: YiiD C-terminal domain-containing protein [Steroidobacteraceae bacterium]|jgi:thioesterase domain-containing protein|nr:YiiD C-terminal domain-containing protein [Steroidobacteraceae bacterium]
MPKTQPAIGFGVPYLQERIDREIMLAKPMGIIVESANDSAMVLRAPLAPNANHKGTAFGGSLYSLAVLTGWAWITRFLAERELDAEAVIQRSSMHFLAPVHGEMRACIEIPAEIEIDKFQRMLLRAARGRIRLQVKTHAGSTLATVFDGLFAAAMRR